MRAYDAGGWNAWRRSFDYYDEGTLIWLEFDTTIRRLSKGRRSLDDFCRRFHGGPGGAAVVKPFTFEDVVAELNAVAPHDWKTLLTRRLTETSDQAPMAGFHQGGWRLAFAEKPTPYEKAAQALRKQIDLSASLGLQLAQDGGIADVIPGKPADKAGLGPGMKVLAVNTRRFSPEVLQDALAAGKKPGTRMELLVENGDIFRTYVLDYHGGARHPRLERIPGRPDLLSQILTPLTSPSGEQKTTGTAK
jgi:predicted metalloprotease with PDZ domain